MKRRNISKFILSLLASFMLVITGINVNGRNKVVKAEEEKYSYTIDENSFKSNGTFSLGDVEWTLNTDSTYFGSIDKDKGKQIGSSNSPAKTLTLTSDNFFYETTISKIVVNTSGAKSIAAKLNVTIDGNSFGSTYTLTQTANDATFTSDSEAPVQGGIIVLSYTQTSQKAIYIKSISITYEKLDLPTLSTPTDAIFDSNTIMVTPDTNASSYEVGLFDTTDNLVKSFPITLAEAEEGYTIDFAPQGEYTVKVKAIGDNKNYVSSEWSESIGTYTQNTINTKTVSEIASLASETEAPYTYYQVTGVVSEITAPSTGKFKLKDLETTDVIQVNGLKSKKENKTNSFDNLDIMVNDIITIIGYKTNNGMEGSYLSDQVENPIERKYGETFALDQTKSQLMFSYTTTSSNSYEKVTSSLNDYSGTYLIVYESGTNAYILNGSAGDTTKNYVSATIIDNSIALNPEVQTAEVKIESMVGGYAIKASSGYLSENSDITTDNSSQQLHTIDISNGEALIKNSNKYIKFNANSGQYRFRYYSSTSQKAISLYKKQESYNITSNSLRFGTTITKDLYDRILSKDSNATFGVISQTKDALNGAELTVDNKGDIEEIVPVRVANENETTADDTGSYYQFSVLYTGIEAENYDTEITARCYVCIDGTYYYMEAATYSVKTLADYYLTNCNTNEAVIAHSGALNYLQNYTASAE